MKTLHFLTASAFALMLAAPLSAQEVTRDTVLTTVNGTDITVGHLITARSALPEQYANLPDQNLFDGLLSQLVQQTLLSQSIGEPTPRVLISLENERRTLLSAEAISTLFETSLSEDDVRALYAERYGEGSGEPEYNASHILVDSEEEAIEIRNMIVSDGADFAETAKAKSTGPSGPNGGELGWFGPGMMVPAFEAAVKELEKDGVSEPVQTQFGWHIVKLNDSRQKAAPSFEEVAQSLINELQQNAVAELVEELRETATIVETDQEIDVSVIRNVDLLTD
ncbi:MAG: peptidylprolyl isomerase [Pseudomonadota bacterium]